MNLYVCGQKGTAPAMHPCGKAKQALDRAGYSYELKVVEGYRLMPWTWSRRAQDRAEVERLSGQRQVPILVLENGDVISGSGSIARWAKDNPATP